DTNLENYSILADPMLEKVFFNLLDNSLRHGETVSKIRVFTRKNEDYLDVIWEDNGIGITEEDKDFIFERGFGKNTGLGMFLVREILSLTDITITENGKPGIGARFEISVPKGMYKKTDA
ncbi:sensor histidine kinase, partial [Methanospirillum stamsii]